VFLDAPAYTTDDVDIIVTQPACTCMECTAGTCSCKCGGMPCTCRDGTCQCRQGEGFDGEERIGNNDVVVTLAAGVPKITPVGRAPDPPQLLPSPVATGIGITNAATLTDTAILAAEARPGANQVGNAVPPQWNIQTLAAIAVAQAARANSARSDWRHADYAGPTRNAPYLDARDAADLGYESDLYVRTVDPVRTDAAIRAALPEDSAMRAGIRASLQTGAYTQDNATRADGILDSAAGVLTLVPADRIRIDPELRALTTAALRVAELTLSSLVTPAVRAHPPRNVLAGGQIVRLTPDVAAAAATILSPENTEALANLRPSGWAYHAYRHGQEPMLRYGQLSPEEEQSALVGAGDDAPWYQ
jgi:hypothetical protein